MDSTDHPIEAEPTSPPHSRGNTDSTLQTLDRGLMVLEVLAAALHPVTLADLSTYLGLHRSIVYRLLKTLQRHSLVERTPLGWVLGTRSASIGRTALPIVQQAAKSEIARLAFRTGLSAFLVVKDRAGAVTLVAVEVESDRPHSVYGPGVRHPLILGSPGLAILAGEPPQSGERPEVTRGRQTGFVMTFGEVIDAQGSAAAPVVIAPGDAIGAVAITFGHRRPGSAEINAVVESARIISGRLTRAVLRGGVIPHLTDEETPGVPEIETR